MFGILDLIDLCSMTKYVLDSYWCVTQRIGYKSWCPENLHSFTSPQKLLLFLSLLSKTPNIFDASIVVLNAVDCFLIWIIRLMEQHTLKNLNNCLNTNSYRCQVLIFIKCCSFFSTLVLIRRLWLLKTVVFLHWCLRCVVLLARDCHVHAVSF